MDDFNFNDEFDSPKPVVSAPQTAVRKQTRQRGILIGIGSLLLAAVFFTVGWFSHYYSLGKQKRDLLWLIDTVEKNYYKPFTDEEWEKMYDGLYDAVLPDQFCSFFSPEEYAALVRAGQGSNADTGLSAIDYEGALRVYHVVGNSPAALAGIESGMTIYRFGADPDALKTGTRDDLYASSGANGSFYFECGYSAESKKLYQVTSGEYLASYCVYRDSESSFTFTGTDRLVLTETNKPIAGLDGDTAYVRLLEFDGKADEEFADLVLLMKQRNRKHLIIDLRNNGGGYLSTLQSIASHLMRDAKERYPLVASAKYRNGKTSDFNAYDNDFELYFEKGSSRIAVLADENTASASECLIGALIDYGTCGFEDVYLRKTEGEQARSYGKGVMQSAYLSATGSALRLTSAEIYWPKGKSIHGVGVTEKVTQNGAEKGDGAVGIVAPLLPGETDSLLQEVVLRLCG